MKGLPDAHAALLEELVADEMARVTRELEDSHAHIFASFNSGLQATANAEMVLRDGLERRFAILAETMEVLLRD